MPYRRTPKRLLDVAVASLVLVVASPVYAVCVALVRLTSGRPVHFTQQRAGKGGKPFDLVKLRTMTVGTHEAEGGYHTAASITPVGKVLRKTSLDELPQVLNVLRGDMSLVGPRPALLDQVARYTAAQRRRLEVRPGVTGLAQVRFRNEAPWSVRIVSDVEYVDTCSAMTDLRIILQTIPRVLFGSGYVDGGQTAAEVDDLGPPAGAPR